MEYINLNKQIRESDSKFLKMLPNFCISWLEKIIQQDEINRILSKYSNYQGVEFLTKIVEELSIKVEIEGIENLPANGKCFFVANHPFGFVDGLILTKTVGEKYGDFRAIGNEVFMLIPQLKSNIAPINVFGTNRKEYLLELEKLFNSDLPITHFPSGIVSRIKKGVVEDNYWHKGFIKKAIEHQRKVVPIYFYGRNSSLFYIIYLTRTFLGIKRNFELVLLPNEIFHKRNTLTKVKIGKPISYHIFDKTRSHYDWAQFVKEHVYNLKSV